MKTTPDMPGTKYFLTPAAACTGVGFVGIGLWSAVASLAGGDPFDGIDHGGVAGMAVAFSLVYIERVTRWQRASPGMRRLARGVMTWTLIMSTLCVVACLYLAFVHGSYPHLSLIFGLFAALCQPATIYWLARARPRAVAVAG